ncbi:MAG: hypothetical protein WBR18_07205 [Anaerolineales bacterium]
MKSRVAIAALLATAILIVSLLVVGPERALAALRGLIGYIPGVGLVDDSSELRVLSAPASLERDGVSLTIEDGVADPRQTIILFTVEGIPAEAYTRDEDDPGCGSEPSLQLPDGSVLRAVRGQVGGWGSGYQARIAFGPLPSVFNEAVFSLECIDGTRPGAIPENWDLTLRFEPAPADLTIAPVLEITPESETPTSDPKEAVQAGSEMGLYLEKVIELPEDFILVGEFRQGDALPNARVLGVSSYPEITDAQGRDLPFETPSDLDLMSTDMGTFPWAFQIPKGFASPLKITFQAVDVEHMVDTTFQFDAGANPVPGQTWSLDQTMQIAGYTVHIVEAVRQESGYQVTFEADPAVSYVSATDMIHQPLSGSGGGQGGEFTVAFEYAPPIPAGTLEYQVRGLIARYEGPWTLTWAAPEGTEGVGNLDAPEACLDLETWQQLSNDPPHLPDGLSGKLVLYGPVDSGEQGLSPGDYVIYLFDLSTAERKVVGPGTWPALSPDGSSLIYSWSDGLYLYDLAAGQSRVILGTLEGDYNPRWSPDRSEIAFVRSDDFNLYIMDADGSNIRKATEGREYEQLVGWMPHGHELAYVFQGAADEMRLYFLDLDSGTIQEGLTLDKGKALDAEISPDGQRIAYTARVRGKLGYGLFVSDIDGSDPRLLVQLDHWAVGAPAWSPDGGWLMVNITNTDLPSPSIGLGLLEPDTCDAFPLGSAAGHLFGWSR